MISTLPTSDSPGGTELAQRWLRTWSRLAAAVELEGVSPRAAADRELGNSEEVLGHA